MSSIYRPGDAFAVEITVTSPSNGAAADPDNSAMPVAKLLKNGAVDSTAVVSMSRSLAGLYYATCNIPAGYSVGDRIAMLVTATVGGVTGQGVFGATQLVGFPPTALPNAAAGSSGGLSIGDTPGTMTLVGLITTARAANLDHLDTSVSTRLASVSYTTPPTASQVAQAVLTDTVDVSVAGSLGSVANLIATNLDAKISSRSTYAGGVVAGVSTPVTVGTVNDKAGYSLAGGVTVAEYATGMDPASMILATPANKLSTDLSGLVALASAGLDAIVIEPGINARQAISPILAASAGTLSGAGTGSVVVRAGVVQPSAINGAGGASATPTNSSAAAATRIVATTDASGNRSSVALFLPA